MPNLKFLTGTDSSKLFGAGKTVPITPGQVYFVTDIPSGSTDGDNGNQNNIDWKGLIVYDTINSKGEKNRIVMNTHTISAVLDGEKNPIATTYAKVGTFAFTSTATNVVLNYQDAKNGDYSATIGAATTSQAGVITTQAQSITGHKTIDAGGSLTIARTDGFVYAGISVNSANAYKPLWFSGGVTGTPTYNNGLKYNPATATLEVANITGKITNATNDDKGNNIANTYVSSIFYDELTANSPRLGYKTPSNVEKFAAIPVASNTVSGVITCGAQTLTGDKTINSSGSLTVQKAGGFNYTGLQEHTVNASVPLWMGTYGKIGTPTYSLGVTWHPVTKTLEAEKFKGLASHATADALGNNISATHFSDWTTQGGGGSNSDGLNVKITPITTNGSTLTSKTLTLPVASVSAAGVITNSTQTFAGGKTFRDTTLFSDNIIVKNSVKLGTDNKAEIIYNATSECIEFRFN